MRSRSKAGLSAASKAKKPKKVFNDYHLKVLPKYPKEYLRYGNIMEVINELYEVQSDLCLSYFSADQIASINCFLNNCRGVSPGSKPHAKNQSGTPDNASNVHNTSH